MLRWLVPLVVLVCACAAFGSVAGAGFVNLDDDQNFVLNQGFRGLDAEHLRWMLTTGHMGHWQPLTWLSFGLDHARAGLDPGAFHRTSLALHGLSALAVYLVALAALARARPGAAADTRRLGAGLAALLFAVHPLRAESVAWITGRNDVVAGLFLALAAAAWLGAERPAPTELRPRLAAGAVALCAAFLVLVLGSLRLGERGFLEPRGLGAFGVLLGLGCLAAGAALVPRALGIGPGRTRALYFAACAATLFSLGGKAYAVVTPALLLVLDLWPLRRLPTRDRAQLARLVLEKLPFAALALVAGIIAWWAKSSAVDSMSTLAQHEPLERVGQAFFGLAWYLRKTLAPTGLSAMVDLPARVPLAEPRFLVPLVAVTLLTVWLVKLRERAPALLAAWCGYVVLALPILGLTQSGAQLVADRYSYVVTLPFALLAGGAWTLLFERRRAPALALAALVVAALGVATWRQAALWRDSETLYRHGIALTGSPRLITNLAMVHNERALALEGATREAELGRALELCAQARRVAEARGLVTPRLWLHEGLVLLNLGRDREALAALDAYTARVPDDVHGLVNLGLVLCRLGGFEGALAPLERAAALAPTHEPAWRYLGLALEGVGRSAEAAAAYRRALGLAPGQPLAAARLAALEAAE